MRYLIKAITAHESEQAAADRMADTGILTQVERLEGFLQGVGDEDAVATLAQAGLTVTVSPLPPVPEPQAPGLQPFSVRLGAEFRVGVMPAVIRPDGRSDYFLLQIVGGLSNARKQALANAGINLVERDHGDWYVAKLPNRHATDALDFVTDVRVFDAAETMGPPPSSDGPESASFAPDGTRIPPAARIYEATLHADASVDAVVAELTGLGAQILSRADRLVRLLPDKVPLIDIADLPQIAQLLPARIARLFDDEARNIIGLEAIKATLPVRLLDLDGDDELIGVADTGIDDTHPDFAGRIKAMIGLGRPGNTSDPNGHGTHVAGSILGDGSQSGGKLAGVAPKAELYFQSLMDVNGRLGGLPADIKILFQAAYDAGVRVHNNSWGAYLYARYAATSLQVDAFVYAHPDFLPVIAAGNDGSCLPGRMVKVPGFVDYPSLAAPGSAKNGLTVGASRNSRTVGGYSQMTWGAAWPKAFPAAPIGSDTISGDREAMAGFSARGPVEDSQIKPDVTAPGTDIASTRSSLAPLRNFWGAYPGNPSYAYMGGTSMATPLVTGCVALVRQYYRRDRGHVPSAALMKATIINGTAVMSHSSATADPAGFPNYHQGFGRVDLTRTLPNPDMPEMQLFFIDSPSTTTRVFTALGQRFRWQIDVDRPGPLRICLVWTDPPAKGLQNTLMAVLDNGALGDKWVSNAGAATLLVLQTPLAWAGLPIHFDRDANNNVHIIRIDVAAPGTYTLTLIADLLTTDNQAFACVVTGPITGLSEMAP